MKLFDFLGQFAWYRRLTGGWYFNGAKWVRPKLVSSELPEDLSDDFCVRKELQDFLQLCDKENQRERT